MKTESYRNVLHEKKLAGLLGPVMIILTLSEIWNAGMWSQNSAVNIYQNGALLFVAGLAIVRSHNRWIFRWTIIITLTGWFAMLLGIYRVFFPGHQLSLATRHHGFMLSLPVTLSVLATGAYLTKKGFQKKR